MDRIENVEQLKALLFTLIETSCAVMDLENYGITFLLNDSLKKSRNNLQKMLSADGWDGNAWRDENRNVILGLSSNGAATLCIATVMSLHDDYLNQFDY